MAEVAEKGVHFLGWRTVQRGDGFGETLKVSLLGKPLALGEERHHQRKGEPKPEGFAKENLLAFCEPNSPPFHLVRSQPVGKHGKRPDA